MSASPELIETADCLCLASRRAARTITQAFDRKLRVHGLRATQFTLLAVLALQGERTVGELARNIGVDRTTLTRNMAVAESRGLIASRRAEVDARSRLVGITPAGRTLLAEAFASWREVQAGLTSAMGDEAADRLRQLARGALSPARASGPRPSPG